MVQVPVLGVVTGMKKLSDIIAGTTTVSPPDEPAVVTRALDAKTAAAMKAAAPAELAAADSGDLPPAPGETPVAAADPKTDATSDTAAKDPAATPAAAPDAAKKPAADDPQAKAAKLLQLAENYLNVGMKDKAIEKLNEIVRSYPGTPAAATAEATLGRLK